MNCLCNRIQASYIDFRGFTNLLDLLFIFDQLMTRNRVSFQCITENLLIEFHMALLILQSAATPAGIITTYFLICHNCLLSYRAPYRTPFKHISSVPIIRAIILTIFPYTFKQANRALLTRDSHITRTYFGYSCGQSSSPRPE